MGQLLFLVVDTLEGANWQRTGRKSGKPRRLHQRLLDVVHRRAQPHELTPEQMAELVKYDPAVNATETETEEVSE